MLSIAAIKHCGGSGLFEKNKVTYAIKPHAGDPDVLKSPGS